MKSFMLRPDRRILYSAEDVADLFVNATRHWYEERTNDFFGRRVAVRNMIVTYLQTGKDTSVGPTMIYAMNKFQSEWMEEDGLFVEAT